MTQRQLIGRTVTILGVIVLSGILIWFVRAVTDVLVLLQSKPGFAKARRPGLRRNGGYGAPVILDEDTVVWAA